MMVMEAELGTLSRMEGVLAALGDVTDKHVVDIGCGEGAMARALAEQGAIVAGYDPFIEGSGDAACGAGRYRLSQARADAIPQADGSADIVLFVFSLHHVPHDTMPSAIAEARRLLAPGGTLCVAEPVAEGPAQYVMAPYHDETVVRAQALAALGDHAAPFFEAETVLSFSEPRRFDDFDGYAAEAIGNLRYNDYQEADILSAEVRERFAEMMARHQGRFDQPVRINLFR